jgi:hypothetical protein
MTLLRLAQADAATLLANETPVARFDAKVDRGTSAPTALDANAALVAEFDANAQFPTRSLERLVAWLLLHVATLHPKVAVVALDAIAPDNAEYAAQSAADDGGTTVDAVAGSREKFPSRFVNCGHISAPTRKTPLLAGSGYKVTAEPVKPYTSRKLLAIVVLLGAKVALDVAMPATSTLSSTLLNAVTSTRVAAIRLLDTTSFCDPAHAVLLAHLAALDADTDVLHAETAAFDAKVAVKLIRCATLLASIAIVSAAKATLHADTDFRKLIDVSATTWSYNAFIAAAVAATFESLEEREDESVTMPAELDRATGRLQYPPTAVMAPVPPMLTSWLLPSDQPNARPLESVRVAKWKATFDWAAIWLLRVVYAALSAYALGGRMVDAFVA